MHERVLIVQAAEVEINAAYLDLIEAGETVVEDACEWVARVELRCLRYSKGEAFVPSVYAAGSMEAMKLWQIVVAAHAKHGLTWGETARIVHHLSDSWLSYIVRVERHGDREDARADFAYEES